MLRYALWSVAQALNHLHNKSAMLCDMRLTSINCSAECVKVFGLGDV